MQDRHRLNRRGIARHGNLRGGLPATADRNWLDRFAAAIATTSRRFWSDHGWAVTATVSLNLIPLFGVALLGWNIPQVLLVYWLETALLVLTQPIRGVVRRGWHTIGKQLAVTAHASAFSAGHLFFLLALLYGIQWDQAAGGPLSWSAPTEGGFTQWLGQAVTELPPVALVVVGLAYTGSFAHELTRLHRLRRADVAAGRDSGDVNEARLYGPMIVLHVAILFGGSAILAMGSPIGLLLMLMALKMGYELYRTVKGDPGTPSEE